jgi:hypothetical protein
MPLGLGLPAASEAIGACFNGLIEMRGGEGGEWYGENRLAPH